MGYLSFNSGKFLVDVNCGVALLSALTPSVLTAVLLFGSASIAAQTGTEPSISTQRTAEVAPLEPGKPIVKKMENKDKQKAIKDLRCSQEQLREAYNKYSKETR